MHTRLCRRRRYRCSASTTRRALTLTLTLAITLTQTLTLALALTLTLTRTRTRTLSRPLTLCLDYQACAAAAPLAPPSARRVSMPLQRGELVSTASKYSWVVWCCVASIATEHS